MQPPSPHSHFFSSLKRLEKRLKLDTPSHPPPPPNHQQSIVESSTESLSSPLFLNSLTQPTTTTSNSNLQESEIPQEFFSNSPDFTPIQAENPPQEPKEIVEGNEIDDIDLLMQLLGLSGCEGGGSQRAGQKLGYDDGFYGNIVGVKGVKSGKELERLDGWIKHFMNGDNGEKERSEPLRLAHLLLGKAAFLHSMDSDGSGGFEFPSTIDEFLQNDPPSC